MHIRIISPAGSIKPRLIDQGAATLRSWGHQVSIGAHAKETYGRYAASPADRAQDVIDALQDQDVDILWASRGGYGCIQILDQIPLPLVSEAHKPIFGYSDITALHALWQQAGVQSVHGPMMKHLGEEPGHRTSKTLRELLEYYACHKAWPQRHNLLFAPMAKVQPGLSQEDPAQVVAQYADVLSLPWVGGNLAVFSALHGTPFDYDYRDKVLFIEDIGESPYKVDRMLYQLHLTGALDQIRALFCGQFTGTEEDPLMPLKMWDNIRIFAEQHNLPVWMGAPIGHVTDNYPVIIGAERANNDKLQITNY